MHRARADVNTMASLVLRGAAPEEAVPLVWPLVCGARVAQRTRALQFSEGELTVQVPDKSWRTELTGYLPLYLHEFKKTTGFAVEKIKFVVSFSGPSS